MDPDLADELGNRVLAAVRRTFGDAVVAVILKGSAHHGDFFPGFSDFDIHAYLDARVMRGPRAVHPELAFQFQALIGCIDLTRYEVSQVQVYFISPSADPDGWLPPLPGSYRVLLGELPTPRPVSPEELVIAAGAGLRRIDRNIDVLIERLVDKPNARLAEIVRLIGTDLKPGLRQAAILLGVPAFDAWVWPLTSLLGVVEPAAIPDGAASEFFSRARGWGSIRQDPDELRAMGRLGIRALEALAAFGCGYDRPRTQATDGA